MTILAAWQRRLDGLALASAVAPASGFQPSRARLQVDPETGSSSGTSWPCGGTTGWDVPALGVSETRGRKRGRRTGRRAEARLQARATVGGGRWAAVWVCAVLCSAERSLSCQSQVEALWQTAVEESAVFEKAQ